MLGLAPPRPRRKPSLTPMIDVVFLLLVFFMLASRFGTDFAISLNMAGKGSAVYTGPPRVVDILPEDIRLNGVSVDETALLTQLGTLTEAPSDTIVIRPKDGVVLQRIVDTMQVLDQAGFQSLVLVE